MIFDTHAHYDDRAFDEDRDKLLSSFRANGIGRVINVSAEPESLERTRALTEKYDFIYGAYGIHPDDIYGITDEVEKRIEELLEGEKCVAVGEVGLDYYHSKENKADQIRWFGYFIDAALRHSLPIIVHSRDAAEDTYNVMKENSAGEAGGVMHCYSYSKEMAKRLLDLGFYFGLGGVATFKNAKKLHEAIEYIPLERMLLETDCPYLAPVPFRGKRNSSLLIPYTVKAISQIKGADEQEVISVTEKNALELFKIDTYFS